MPRASLLGHVLSHEGRTQGFASHIATIFSHTVTGEHRVINESLRTQPARVDHDGYLPKE